MLFWEGEPCAGIFLIVENSVEIFKTSAGGREMMLSLEAAPASVAELSLFDGGLYPASVREVVSRNLARFRADGLIRIQEHRVTIADKSGLEREAEGQV